LFIAVSSLFWTPQAANLLLAAGRLGGCHYRKYNPPDG
jgi:hypothetical protein